MDVYNVFRHLILIILDIGYVGGTVELICMSALLFKLLEELLHVRGLNWSCLSRILSL